MMMPWRKRNRRKSDSPRRFQLPRMEPTKLLTVLGLCGAAAALIALLGSALDRPVARVAVEGKFQRVSPLDVEQAIAPFRRSGFLSIDLDAMKHALEGMPWVDRVRVERSWPDGVRVFVLEQVPAARWGEGGLLNTRGELFLKDVKRIPPELPQLDGPEGTQWQVARLYLDTYPRLLSAGMRLAHVTLDARGAWEFALANGVAVRLGRQDIEERLERFIKVACPLVAARPGDIAYVDMRYANGFAVGWSSSAAVADKRSGSLTPDA